jgi:hypothetical protein
MEKRQELLNQEYKKNYTIIFPIKFGDGEHFHKDAQKTQMEDLSNWNYTAEGFRKSEKFMEFEKIIEDIAKTLSKMILEVPVWNPHWPVYSPGSEKVKKIISECRRKSEKNFKKPRM